MNVMRESSPHDLLKLLVAPIPTRPIDDALIRASPRRPPAAGLVATPASVVAALIDAVAPRGPPLSTLAAHPAPPGEGDPFCKALRLASKHLGRWHAAAIEHAPVDAVPVRHASASPPHGAVGHADVPGLLRSVALLQLLGDAEGAPVRTPMATVALVKALLAAATTAACFLAATGPPRREWSPSVAALCQLSCRALRALAAVLREAVQAPGTIPVLDVLPPLRVVSLLMAVANTTIAAASIAALPDARAVAVGCVEGCAGAVYWLVWGAGGGRVLHSDLSGAKVVEMLLEAPLVALEDDQVVLVLL